MSKMMGKPVRIILGMALISALLFSTAPMGARASPTIDIMNDEFNPDFINRDFNPDIIKEPPMELFKPDMESLTSGGELITFEFTEPGYYHDTITISFVEEDPDYTQFEINIEFYYEAKISGEGYAFGGAGYAVEVVEDGNVEASIEVSVGVETSAGPSGFAYMMLMARGEASAMAYQDEMLAVSAFEGSLVTESKSYNGAEGESFSYFESLGYASPSIVQSWSDASIVPIVNSEGGTSCSSGRVDAEAVGLGVYPYEGPLEPPEMLDGSSWIGESSNSMEALVELQNSIDDGALKAVSSFDAETSATAFSRRGAFAIVWGYIPYIPIEEYPQVESYAYASSTEVYCQAYKYSESWTHSDRFSLSCTSHTVKGSSSAEASNLEGYYCESEESGTFKSTISAIGRGFALSIVGLVAVAEAYTSDSVSAESYSWTDLYSDPPRYANMSAKVREEYSHAYVTEGDVDEVGVSSIEWAETWIEHLHIKSWSFFGYFGNSYSYYEAGYDPSGWIEEYDDKWGSVVHVYAPLVPP